MPIPFLKEPIAPKSSQAPFLNRAIAYLFDLGVIYCLTLITAVAYVVAYTAIAKSGNWDAMEAVGNSAKTSLFLKISHLFYYLSYFTITHWYFGRTWGKWLLGLTVTFKDGASLSFSRAIARSFLYLVSGQITLGVGFILPLFRKDGKTLHDLLANTQVLKPASAKAKAVATSVESDQYAA